MKLAAVILNYNDANGTVDAIKRIAGFSCFTDIIVVDNASSDDSAHIITTELEITQDSRIYFIVNDKNGGYGYGNNAGVRYAHDKLGADLAVIANPDAVFDEALIISMQRIFEQDKDTAVVGAVMRSHAKTARSDYYSHRGDSKSNMNLSAGLSSKKDNKRRYIDITKGRDSSSQKASKPNQLSETFTYDECIASGWMRRSTLQCMLNSGPISRRLFKSYINYPESYYKGLYKTESYPEFERKRSESGVGASSDMRYADGRAEKENVPSNAAEVYAVHGSLLMVSTEKFIEVGGYDEEMFLYGEENVLAEKLYRSRYKTYLLQQGYEHAGSVSITGAGLKAVRRQQLRNASENYYYRHYLDCDESGMNIVKLFQKAVLAETRIAASLHLI